MAATQANLAGRFREFVRQWLAKRRYELVHCHACDCPTEPLATLCPHCGQESPSKLAPSAAIGLVLLFVVLAAVAVTVSLLF